MLLLLTRVRDFRERAVGAGDFRVGAVGGVGGVGAVRFGVLVEALGGGRDVVGLGGFWESGWIGGIGGDRRGAALAGLEHLLDHWTADGGGSDGLEAIDALGADGSVESGLAVIGAEEQDGFDERVDASHEQGQAGEAAEGVEGEKAIR